jgi:hypothetical protein
METTSAEFQAVVAAIAKRSQRAGKLPLEAGQPRVSYHDWQLSLCAYSAV